MQLALFDFDGTITTKDTLIDFAAYVKNKPMVYLYLASLAPALVKFKRGKKLKKNPKESFMQYFFGGLTDEQMRSLGEEYVERRLPELLNPAAVKKMEWHKAEGHEIAVVSASPEQWLEPFCRQWDFRLISTRLEVKDGIVTGKVAGKNCNGREKERRIREVYQLEDYERIYAYGNSGGDKHMLALAHEKFYKTF